MRTVRGRPDGDGRITFTVPVSQPPLAGSAETSIHFHTLSQIDARNQLLDALSPAGRDTLLKQSVEKQFATGEVLWSAGDRSEGITLVLEGKVRIVRGSGGRQLVIHSGEPGATLELSRAWRNSPPKSIRQQVEEL